MRLLSGHLLLFERLHNERDREETTIMRLSLNRIVILDESLTFIDPIEKEINQMRVICKKRNSIGLLDRH